jgi:hypothetical protein
MYGGARGLLMVSWKVCIMPKDEGGIGLVDVATLGSMFATKWVVRCLDGSSSSQVLLRHGLHTTQHNSKIQGSFRLCNIIPIP